MPPRTEPAAVPASSARIHLAPFPEGQVGIMRDLAERDLYFFCKEICGHTLLEPEPHGALCEFLMREHPSPSPQRMRLILMPRTTFKTSVVTEDHTLWELLRDHSLRTLIDSDLRANAKKYALYVRLHLETNPRIRQLWGDLRSEPGWTEEYFTIQRDRHTRESSVMTSGMDQVLVGLHFDRIKITDVVNNTNVNTPEQFTKVREHFGHLSSLLEIPKINPFAERILEGTRWDAQDLYGELMTHASGMESSDAIVEYLLEHGEATWDDLMVFFRSAYHYTRDDRGDLVPRTPLFSLFTPEFLEAKRADPTFGGYWFSANYLNDPVPSAESDWKKEWFIYWDRLPQFVNVYMPVDPAIGTDPNRDSESAIVVAATDKDKRLYLLDAWHGRVAPDVLLGKIFAFYDLYRPQTVGLEQVAFQKYLRYMLYDEMARRQVYFPVRPLMPDTHKTKEGRIRMMQPRYAAGHVLHRRGSRGITDLEMQLLRLGSKRYPKDLADALAYLPQMMSAAQASAPAPAYVPENRTTGY